MKCPACQNPLFEKGAGGMALEVCYGCGGVWFDATELGRVSARFAARLRTMWNVPVTNLKLTKPRRCPRCPQQVLNRKWFSASQKAEIAQCPNCGGVWLDAGGCSRIYDEIKSAKVGSPIWAVAMAEAAAVIEGKPSAPGNASGTSREI